MNSLLGFVLLVGIAADPDEKKKVDPPDAAGKQSAKPKLLLRKRSGTRGTAKRRLRATKGEKREKESAPDVPSRPIPAPDDPRKTSDLDRELLRDLGEGLEKADEEESDPLLRVGRRMRSVEEKLARLDVSDQTIEIQKKIVTDLEDLLDRMNRPPPQQKQPQQKKKDKDSKQKQKQQQQKQRTASVRKSSDSRARPGPRRSGREQVGTQPRTRDVWGHLGELFRDEMSQYFKEGFLPRYRELLERYYTTISAKSRSSSE